MVAIIMIELKAGRKNEFEKWIDWFILWRISQFK